MVLSGLKIISVSWILLCGLSACNQCPSSDSFYKEINSIYNSQLTVKEKLGKLMPLNERINSCPFRDDSTHAFLLRRIGLLYSKDANYASAIEFTQQAIDIIQKNAGKSNINLIDLPLCYYNLHTYYDSTDQEDLKWEAIDSCIAIDLRIVGDYMYSSVLLGDKVTYLLKKGEYILCDKYASLAENILQAPHQMDAKCNIIINHTNALMYLKRYKEAEELLNNQMDAFRHPSCKKYQGSLQTQIGRINLYLESYQKALSAFHLAAEFALDSFQHALDFSKKEEFSIGYAGSISWIAFLYYDKLNQPRTAMDYYRKGLPYGDSLDAILYWSHMGRIYTRLNLFDSAFYCYQEAFNMIKPGCTEETFINDVFYERPAEKIISYATDLLDFKGEAYLRQYKITRSSSSLSGALKVFAIADKLSNDIQSTNLELESKLFWRDTTRALYENAIEACYLSGKVEDAFYFFEKGRSAILNAELNEQRKLPEDLIVKQAKLREENYRIETALGKTEKNSSRYVEIQKALLENNQQLEGLQQQVQVSNPLYFQQFLDTTVVRIQDVRQKLLNNHHCLVELFAGDSAIYILFMTAQKVDFKKVNKPKFDSLSAQYISYLSNIDLQNSKYDEFKQVAHQLYNLLFQGISVPKGRIIFSPDGKYFPFEALVTSLQPTTYFLNEHSVSYTYSIRYLFSPTRDMKKKRQDLFGIAPVQFAPAWHLPSLTGSDASLNRINDNFHATTLSGARATKGNFLRDFYNYGIIQLYTHATDSGSTGEPMIYFADSALSLSELIYGHKPVTNLIVLSACQTGLGKIYIGEGVFNFNRGFATMGIRSSISNLWQVEAQATYRLTELFYKHLANGAPVDVALQKAKLEFIKTDESRKNELPYLWAAPILVGDANFSIQPNSSSRLWWLLILIPILFPCYWLYRKYLTA